MKASNLPFSAEIKRATEERRKKLILVIHAVCFFIFSIHILLDTYYQDYKSVPFTSTMFILVTLSFFIFYQKGKYDHASYAILMILAVETIAVVFIYHFDDYTPGFIFPFILATFSLFSWKRGLIFSITFLLFLVLALFYYQESLHVSVFLHNEVAIPNFISILLITFVFAIYYETTRIDAYKRLINSNYKKDLLYNEIHHRVKNNLNIVSSMLAIQAEQEDQKTQEIIQASKNRIDAMAMVHSMLYVSNDLEKVNAKRFIEKLYLNIQSTINDHVKIVFKSQEIELSLNEIIPIGLIINELVTNSFKYAFKETKNPKIVIVLNSHKNNILLTYFDNGIGYDLNKIQNFGLKLVNLNVKQLKGNLKISYKHGLCYKIIYKRSSNV
ncbi:sensor histidine kinase [Sulfurospirillum oryzae]|uniref:sensor histidine kinase n=1 Tax=Sulfurospirillum oryzae TaxID=2976535 RepID=UPI0021E71E6F|nr:sensor histidine kinase [Sulfurospirillum oryzae]